jgi:hypothetical protein
MKKSTIAPVLMLALSPIFVFAAGKPNFTGTWVMDKSRTEGVPQGTEQTMTLTQSDDKMVLHNKITTDAGENVIDDTYLINGKEVEFTQKVNEQESRGKRTSKWLADGSGFESSEELTRELSDGTKITQQVTRRWVMAADGKSFTVDMTIKGPNGTTQTKRTFVKKS